MLLVIVRGVAPHFRLADGPRALRRILLGQFDRAVIVAVVAMRVMQVAVHEIINVVAMGNGFMPAAGAMLVVGVVTAALMFGRALLRILAADVNDVLVHMVLVRMMEVAIVEIIDMAVVHDRRVSASGAVDMIVVRVLFADAGILKAGHRALLIS